MKITWLHSKKYLCLSLSVLTIYLTFSEERFATWKFTGSWVRIEKQKQSSRGVLLKNVLKNFAKFTGKPLCQSLFFNKVAGLRPATLLKKRLWYRCFPVNFAKNFKSTYFCRTPLVVASGKSGITLRSKRE